jgi:phage baseplate assembly protein W
MDAATGRRLDDVDHIRQSIRKIITTPLGSRVMRRDFGSILPELVDAPLNDVTRMLAMAAIVTALIKWEPRIRPVRVGLLAEGARLTVSLTAAVRADLSAGTQTLTIPLR